MQKIRRGTTPEIRCKLNGGINVADIDLNHVYVTLEQNTAKETFSGDRLTILDNYVYLQLTQTDTLYFKEGPAKIQTRVLDTNGNALATSIQRTYITPILQEWVIGDNSQGTTNLIVSSIRYDSESEAIVVVNSDSRYAPDIDAIIDNSY